MSPLYQLHGLRLRSEIPLSATVAESAPQNGAQRQQHDAEVTRGSDRSVPGEPADEDPLAEMTLPGGAGYSLTKAPHGYLLRFYLTCEIEISRDLRSLVVHADPTADPDLLALLVEGNAVAVILGLRGQFVLHASAVLVGDSAVGFVGGAGMGKSTMAAVMCSGGASVFADDLLSVEFKNGGAICHKGPQVIRLRPGAASLAEGLDGPSGASPDGRTTVALTTDTAQTATLGALVIPSPSREAQELNVRRLSLTDAAIALARYPRVTGWKIDEPWRLHFRGAAQAARTIPVYSAQIPWGPPFGDLLAGLSRALQLSVPPPVKI